MPFWIEAPTEVKVSSNLCADCLSLSLQTVVSAFASLSRFCFSCQPFCFHSIIEPLIIVDSGCNSKSSTSGDLAKTGRPATLVRKLRKINQSSFRRIENRPSQFWLAKHATNRLHRVLQWDCSLRDSLQGYRGTCLTSPNEPASIPSRVGLPSQTRPLQKLHCS